MRITVPRFVFIVTVLTGLIATVLGVFAWTGAESHPQFVEGGYDTLISWGARELGMGLGALMAAFVIRDARGYAIALGSAVVREVLDFIDLFRVEGDFRTALYGVLAVSVVAHSTALWMSMKAIRAARSETAAVGAVIG